MGLDAKAGLGAFATIAPRATTRSIRWSKRCAFRSTGRQVAVSSCGRRVCLASLRTLTSLIESPRTARLSLLLTAGAVFIPAHTARHFLPCSISSFGLFLLDEPEAAFSPQRQLSFLVLIHDVLHHFKDAQFIISTHSPVLLAYPKAQILSFDDGNIHEIDYEQTGSFQVVHRF